MTRCVMVCAGGTGGHMFPALQVQGALERHGIQVVFLTDKRGKAYLPLTSQMYELPLDRLDFRSVLSTVKTFWRLGKSVLYALWVVAKIRPRIVIGFGGYPSGPGLLAGWLGRRPLVVHEQNACLGRVNRWLQKIIHTTALSFPLQRGHVSSQQVLTGIPVREEIQLLGQKPYEGPVAEGPFRVFVVGGSQGATLWSHCIPPAVELLPSDLKQRLFLVQQCRAEDLERVQAFYEATGIRAEVSPFFTDMSSQLEKAHLVLCRAGGSSVGELMAAGRPALLAPFAAAQDDHQRMNSRLVEEVGGGWVLREEELKDPSVLKNLLEELMKHPEKLTDAAQKIRSLWIPQAEENLARLILKLLVSR